MLRGQAVYVGAFPVPGTDAETLFCKLLPTLAHSPQRYRTVTLNVEGETYRFLLNGTSRPAPLPEPCRDVITGRTLAELPPYEVVLAGPTGEDSM